MDENTGSVDNADSTPQDNNVEGVQADTSQMTAAEKRMYKVMVDGQEQEIDEDTLKKGYSHNSAAAKRMDEAARVRKEAEEVIRYFKSNPRDAMARLGLDPRQFAEQFINDELEEALMDPKDKELRQYKKQVEEYEANKRKAQEQYAQEQMQAEVERQTEAIQTEMIQTLETAGLPKTERTVGRIIYYMQSAINAGYNVSPKDVIEHVRNDYVHDFKSMLGGLSEQQIEMFLGADLVRKVAKSSVKAQAKETIVPKAINQNRQVVKQEKKIQSPRDFFSRK